MAAVLSFVDEHWSKVESIVMNNKLFIGNLAYTVTSENLAELFEQFGQVVSCNIATDRDTGRPRGFGFVEMQSQQEAEAAIGGLNGKDLNGRQISVSISQPKPKSRSRY